MRHSMASEWPRPWYSVLWAPWRMKYLKTAGGGGGSCVFCIAPSLDDKASLIVYRGEKAYVILNKYPYNTGHVMIVPYRHVPSIVDLDRGEIEEIALLVNASIEALNEVYKPHGFNVGINIGEAAGAGIAGHVHVHVVPRWRGDANFMVTVGATKVLPEMLEDTYKRVKPALANAVRRVQRRWRESTTSS